MSKSFFIADTHFGSETIIRYEKRPFGSVQEMEEALIAKWNQVVEKDDTVYVLGDFSENQDIVKDAEVLSRLHGKKILVMGNHDTHRTSEEWRKAGFSECSSWPILYEGFFLLSHEPLYINQNMPYANLYGHVHGNASYRDVSRQSACVSVERIDYTPISFDEIRMKMQAVAQDEKKKD